MTLALLVLALLPLVSFVLILPFVWPHRSQVALALIVWQVGIAGLFVALAPGWWSGLYAAAAMYQIINLLRVRRGAIQVDFLRRASLRAIKYLTVAQSVFAVVAIFQQNSHLTLKQMAIVVVTAQLLGALMMALSTAKHLKSTKTLQATQHYADKDLPSISVLIPARNETEELHACLDALVASDYPKLEILVLDDCSQERRTPEIIRGYANKGVRFVAGKTPDESWLAKNFAYQQLVEASSGDLLVFCGVDLTMAPGALRELVTTLLEKEKTMLSVLPHNQPPDDWRSYLLQPVRYGWELSLPRRPFNRPPVLSSCFIIDRTALEQAGGFKAACRSVSPESYLARSSVRGDKYSFVRSNLLVSHKNLAEQRSTGLRLRYPQLHRRIELVAFLSVIELLVLVLPLPLSLIIAWHGAWLLAVAGLVSTALLMFVALQITAVMYGRFRPLAVALAPLLPLVDLWLLNKSMLAYEFGRVEWKDRNICLPVMRQETTTAN